VTLEKTDELIAMRVDLGSGYNRNAARMVVPGEVMRDHVLEQKQGIKPGTHFKIPFK
jgi:hypothetical protein